MSNPYNWNFPQRQQTMFMATIQSSNPNQNRSRQSSFQQHDIPGTHCKQQIPSKVTGENFANSSFIEAVPSSHIMKNKYLGSNNLRTNDIQYAQPRSHDFKTNRVTNPINPRYQLPYVAPIDPQPARSYLRNTLDISDINTKHQLRMPPQRQKGQVEGSSPSKLFRTVEAVNRLDVKDINRDGSFISKRTHNPVNPLQPSYTWRDSRETLNQRYGDIGSRPKPQIQQQPNRRTDLAYSTHDIQGAKANSFNDRRYFMTQRRSIKDTLNNTDIPKTRASSLKKGITTGRQVNPLMPQYPYPSAHY